MQTIVAFYYPNSVEVQVNLDLGIPERNRVMYQRTIKIYKGIDNTIQFVFKNSDQKPVNVTGWTITFNMISDEEGSVIFSKSVTAPTAAMANIGIASTTINELDLADLYSEHYNYSLSFTNSNPNLPNYGSEHVVYADDNYGARGEIALLSGHYPTFKPSIYVTLTSIANSYVLSSSVVSDTPTRQLSAHHTAEIYFNDFTGTVEVQATLDIIPPVGNTGLPAPSWIPNIANVSYTHQNVPSYINWDGVYTACQFIVTPANTSPLSGNVSQILYRA